MKTLQDGPAVSQKHSVGRKFQNPQNVPVVSVQTLLGDFNKEQEKFVTEKKETKKQEDAALAPWIGYNEEEAMKKQILNLSTVSHLCVIA